MLNFSGIGAQKAGTTWVYEHLSKHPDVAFTSVKEVHFWDLFRDRGIDWYKSQFPDGTGKLHGDITPAYAILPVETIKEVHDNFPHIKLFYILRNPVERAWSHAMMEMRRSKIEFDQVSDQWLIEHFNSEGSMKRGDYLTCMKNWLEVYPREQLLVLKYEDISRSPLMFLRSICEFIGLDPSHFDESKREEVSQKVFSGEGHPIKPELKAYLETIYTKEKQAAIDEFLTQKKLLCTTI